MVAPAHPHGCPSGFQHGCDTPQDFDPIVVLAVNQNQVLDLADRNPDHKDVPPAAPGMVLRRLPIQVPAGHSRDDHKTEAAAIMIQAREKCKRSCTVGRYTLAPAAGTDVARVYSSSA